MVDEVPGHLCSYERRSEQLVQFPLTFGCWDVSAVVGRVDARNILARGGRLLLSEVVVSFSVSAARVDVAEAQPLAPTAELPRLDPELSLDPGGVVSQLLTDVDLTQLVEEQPSSYNSAENPQSDKQPRLGLRKGAFVLGHEKADPGT